MTMIKLNDDIRELAINELDAVAGGGTGWQPTPITWAIANDPKTQVALSVLESEVWGSVPKTH